MTADHDALDVANKVSGIFMVFALRFSDPFEIDWLHLNAVIVWSVYGFE